MRIKTLGVYLLFVTAIITSTCSKEDDDQRPYPRIKTLEVTNISEVGATFRAEIYSTTNDPIIEHGFIWGQSADVLNINVSDKIVLGSFSGNGIYDAIVKTSLEKGKIYYVKSYIRTSKYTVYGVDVSFVSLGSEAPTITGFEPLTAKWGDTLTIKGKNFSWQSYSNKVFFGDSIAQIVTEKTGQNDTTIFAIVPKGLKEVKTLLSVELAGNRSTFNQDTFTLITPSISYFLPEIASWNDPVTIFGFFPQIQGLSYSVFFNNTNTTVDYVSQEKIKVRVPINLITVDSNIKIVVNDLEVNSSSLFHLAPPEIESVDPTFIWNNRGFYIYGKNFKLGHTTVKIDGINARIENSYSSDTKLYAIAPNLSDYDNCKLSVKVLDQEIEWENELTYFVPSISYVTPSIITFWDTITIKGNFYNATDAKIGIQNINIIENSIDEIKAIVPSYININDLTVSVKGPWGEVRKSNVISLKEPEVYSLSATEGRMGDTISIYGDYFNPNITYNSINIGKVLFASRNRIDFEVGNISSGILPIILSGSGYNPFVVTNSFLGHSPYKKLNDVPYNNIKNGSYGVYNGYGYNWRGEKLYRYDPTDDNWITLMESLSIGSHQAFFSIDNMLFSIWEDDYGFPFSRVYKYDMENNTLERLNDFPNIRRQSFGFSLNGKGYVGGGYNNSGGFHVLNDLWEYDAEIDQWTQKNDLPSNEFYRTSSFVIDDRAYVLDSKMNLWSYDPENDSWESKSPLPVLKIRACCFTINGLGYIGFGSQYDYTNSLKDLWEYNPTNDQWVRKHDYPRSVTTVHPGRRWDRTATPRSCW